MQEAAAGIPEGFFGQTWPYTWIPGAQKEVHPWLGGPRVSHLILQRTQRPEVSIK